MRILDRYILKSVLLICIWCIFVFLFLYIIIDLLSHLEDILKQQVGLSVLIQYYLSYLPIIFVQVAPFACLLSILYTFGKLNQGNEIIAMRASGLSIFQISKTVIIFGVLVSLFVFWINDRVVPPSLSESGRIKQQIEGSTKKTKERNPEVIDNLSMYGAKNRLFFVNKFSLGKNTMEGIIILEHDEHQNLVKKIVSGKGIYQDGAWKFYQCITYTFDQNGQILDQPGYLEEEVMDIPETPRDFIAQRQRTEFMTISQLKDYMRKLSRSGSPTIIRNLKLDLYQRFTSPFTSLIIIILGVPFALMTRKRATGLSSIGLVIVVGFLYYILDAIAIALGRGGLLTPLLAASLTHIVGLAFSLYLINSLP